jgi:hypothetical protein
VAATLTTPRIAADAIEEIILSQGRTWDRESINGIGKATTLDVSGLKPADYDPSFEFARDMGLD